MKINTANADEIKTMAEWAAQEGWNSGKNDATVYPLADPNGFFVGYIENEMAACISAVKYQNFGFVGFYMVKPEFRGQGYGWQIWQHGMQYLNGCNVALDGVVEQQHNYRKSGFKLAHNNIRYQWHHQQHKAHQIQSLEANRWPMPSIQNYLKDFFPADRSDFNEAWQNQDNASAYLLVEQDNIVAYGVIRSCQQGYKIGPLFANTPQNAEIILNDLTSTVEDMSLIYLDITDRNKAVLPLLDARNAEQVFETARMYTGDEPDINIEHTYGITSFEIG
jgi:GNAT superfamily N-acetyltransferase